MEVNFANLICFVIGGATGSVLTIGIQFIFKIRVSSNNVSQAGNVIGGDNAGRDITKIK